MFNRKILTTLAAWKTKKRRKPLILRGARQVGKTSAALLFASKHFKNLVHLNLENADHQRLFRGNLSLTDFKKILQIKFGKELIPGETLVFFDEIQSAPGLIKLLRFFYEEVPGLHVLAAGSLLEVMAEREGFSFPVGRVDSAYLYPLDFFEFLEVIGDTRLLNYLKEISWKKAVPESLHDEAIKRFYEYAMIGGMPEALKVYSEGGGISSLKTLYTSLLTGYLEDVYKYSSRASSKYLSFIIETAPLYAGTTIHYAKFGGSNFRSREMASAFQLLQKAMILYQAQATQSRELPLIEQSKRPKKMLFLDVGLVNHRMGIQEEYLGMKDLNGFYRGRIAEQVVGQNLLACFQETSPRLHYWAREKMEGSAEVDFCLTHQGRIAGIEVKAGKAGSLRSLLSVAGEIKNAFLCRIYAGPLKREKIQIGARSAEVLSVPFYLIPRILDWIDLF